MNSGTRTLISEEESLKVFDLVKEFERESEDERRKSIYFWKKLDYFWSGIQYLYPDDTGRYISPLTDPGKFRDFEEDLFYTKVLNVYKAHGESIIAALSADFPGVNFYPDDAENPDDVETAHSYSKLAEIIQRHNKAKLILIKAVSILFNKGTVFAYNYSDKKKEYGTYTTDITENKSEFRCPQCGEVLPEVNNNAGDIFATCPNCNEFVEPAVNEFETIVGQREELKSRQVITLYSPLNVFIPFWCKKYSDIPLLVLNEDWHYTRAKEEFPEIFDKIRAAEDIREEEQYARSPIVSYPNHDGLCVIKKVWLQPHAFNGITNKELRDKLKEEFPDGACFSYVNGIPADVYKESMKDHWTISFDPRFEHIHADPIGQSLVDPQEMTNELFNLTIQTIEHGIPQTFVDSNLIDLEKYKNNPARPGDLVPVNKQPGQSIAESFETIKTATVSQEIERFVDKLERASQFVVGSFPSIYGGQIEGSRTASEYQMSRQMALQRLSTAWIIVTFFWAELMQRTVESYIKDMVWDEKFVKPQGDSFINVWIKRASLTGKIGSCEPQTSEQVPITWAQKRDAVIELLGMQIPEVNAVLFHPENSELISNLFGLKELYIPGKNDRNKQVRELQDLMVGQPIPNEQGGMVPSVDIDLQIDDHAIHAQVCKTFLESENGQSLKVMNPGAYENIKAHLGMHQTAIQFLTMGQFEQSPAGENPETQATSTGA